MKQNIGVGLVIFLAAGCTEQGVTALWSFQSLPSEGCDGIKINVSKNVIFFFFFFEGCICREKSLPSASPPARSRVGCSGRQPGTALQGCGWGHFCCWLAAGEQQAVGLQDWVSYCTEPEELELVSNTVQGWSSGRACLSSCREYRIALPKHYYILLKWTD